MAAVATAASMPTEQTVAPRYPAQINPNIAEAVPHALASLGDAIQSFGATAEAQQKQGKDYALMTKLHDFQSARDQEYQDAQRQQDPNADPSGFAADITGKYDTAAKKFFQDNLSNASPEVKAAYDQKLYFGRIKQVRGALNDEQEGRDKYYINGASARLNDYGMKLAQDPDQHDAITERARAEIDALPIPPAKKQRLYDSFANFDNISIMHRLRRGDNPDEVYKDVMQSGVTRPAGVNGGPAPISGQMETPNSDPLKGVSNVSPDTNGSDSFGNLGLNTQKGASAWSFRDTHGKALGITADPGTAEFKSQWLAAAKDRAPELVAAENDWWQKNIASKVGDHLKQAGAGDLAADPRVQTYFADREVQQGAGSTENHDSRVQEAAKAAGGDPVRFLQAMSDIDKSNVRDDFRTYLGQNPGNESGLKNRVDRRLHLSLLSAAPAASDTSGSDSGAETLNAGMKSANGKMLDQLLPDGEEAPKVKYPNLGSDERMKIAQKVLDAARQKRTEEIDSGIEAIKQTGEAPVGSDGKNALERATSSQSLTPKQIESHAQKWASAQLEYKMTGPLDNMTPDEMGQHLEQFTPDPKSPDYKVMVQAQKNADKKMQEVLSKRSSDPALSVNDLGEVRQAWMEVGQKKSPVQDVAGIQVEQKPIAPQEAQKIIIGARLAAQDRVGIPPAAQSPITREEAQALLGMGDKPDAVLATDPNHAAQLLRDAASRAQLKYGPEYGSLAFRSAVRFLVRGTDNRETATNLIASIASGKALNPRDAALYQQEKGLMPMRQFGALLGGEQGSTAAQAPFGGMPVNPNSGPAPWFQGDRTSSPFANPAGTASHASAQPLPTEDQIKIIQDHPEKWREIDSIFGPGATARAMQTDLNAKPSAPKKDGWSLSNLWGGKP